MLLKLTFLAIAYCTLFCYTEIIVLPILSNSIWIFRRCSMLKATDIKLNYGNHQVLDGVSLHVTPGTCCGILGVNGCGKSTLLKILAGVLPPTGGCITYNNEDALHSPAVFLNYAGYVPQDNPLMEELSVLDNLRLWYADSRLNLQAETDNGVLHMLGLHKVLKQRVSTLSGGMKKRLSIGIALANRPAVLILDEPTAALDIPCKDEIHSYLRLYMQNGGTIIIATHEEPDLDLCDQLNILRNGTLHQVPASARGVELSRLLTPALQNDNIISEKKEG